MLTRCRAAVWLGLAGLVSAARPLLGATGSPSPQMPPLGQGLDVPWGRVVSSTLFVVALICVGVYVLKRLSGGALAGGRYMQVMECRQVGRKTELMLVKVAGRVVLLSSSGENVTRLAEFDECELPESEPVKSSEGVQGFRLLLHRLAGARG